MLCGRPSAAPIGAGDGAVDAGQPAVADDHPAVADAVARAPSGRGRGPGWRRRRTAGRPAGSARADRAGDVVRRERPGSASRRVELARDARAVRGRATPRATRGSSGRAATVARDPARPRRPGYGAGPGRSGRRAATTSTSSRASSRLTGRDSVGCPNDHDALDPAGELRVGEQQPVGADRVRRRCATRWSARRAAASPPAPRGRGPAGPASSPATTTVRGPGVQPARGSRRAGSPGAASTARRPTPAVERAPQPSPGLGEQRLLELEVEVHRTGRPPRRPRAVATRVRPGPARRRPAGAHVRCPGEPAGRRGRRGPRRRRSRPGRWSGWRRCRAAARAGRR